ncbi:MULTISPECIES: nitroreductase family protein [Bacillota]|uniref:Nitroreductase family protein n=2 Tax=Amedibacillus TaxID=2749846 RepID=A0A7G9GJE5_9FIRM|nr:MULTISPECIES: nitroreductase family protein [Bacillota]QNM10927.1 nitroreductase family protein [[Eubacterium] hominis]MCH4285363.1 nitroreductase family protein [Amedibacillus hominis]RGB58419.1 nitroreductase family protein [Absiella sp. AM22-9]RGB63307.1 nitroreductase family protein [Absiella sp. AM10-20]RGB67137.1 nitroreductase family protein [Absiella sp. AM09-45]
MLKELYERQSIRKYLDKPVEEEKIMELLRAAMNAPTARNTQSWRFMVIENREALDHMQTLSPYTGMMKTAPCAIMVLGDKRDIEPEEYLYVNAAAAIENMLIEAVHQGLGTCWCAIGPRTERIENFRNYFHIEDHLIPIGVVAVGYGDEVKPKVDRFDPEKISYYK